MWKIVALIFILTMTSCTGEKNYALDKGTWEVKEIDGKKEFQKRPWMKFDFNQMQISGNSSCNNFFGGLTMENDEVSFENIGATRMACANMSTEDLFFTALGKIDYFEFIDDELHLLSLNRDILIKLEQTQIQPL